MKPLAIFIELRGAFVIAGWHVRWTNASGEPHEFLEILMHRPPEGYADLMERSPLSGSMVFLKGAADALLHGGLSGALKARREDRA